jgi:hypothetical protein
MAAFKRLLLRFIPGLKDRGLRVMRYRVQTTGTLVLRVAFLSGLNEVSEFAASRVVL